MPNRSMLTLTRKGKLPRALTEPIIVKHYRPTVVGLSADEADKKNEEESRRVGVLLRDKIELLFGHFSIPKTGNPAEDYCALLLELAVNGFSGFQIRLAGTPSRGRPSHGSILLMGLLNDVEEKKRSMQAVGSPVSDARALEALTGDPFRRRWARYKPRRLANMLADARNPHFNPLYALWSLSGEDGKLARRALAKLIAESRKTSA